MILVRGLWFLPGSTCLKTAWKMQCCKSRVFCRPRRKFYVLKHGELLSIGMGELFLKLPSPRTLSALWKQWKPGRAENGSCCFLQASKHLGLILKGREYVQIWNSCVESPSSEDKYAILVQNFYWHCRRPENWCRYQHFHGSQLKLSHIQESWI